MKRLGLAFLLIGFLSLLLAACSGDRDYEDNAVHVLEYDGNVDPVLERYVERGLDQAVDDNARALVIELDTPGGLLDTTRNIVQDISESEIPVIVWVTPEGAHAASAGTFITIAGHVAAMSPGTNIGAASVIDSSGEDIEGTLGKKIENDTVAFVRSIAEERGRNADWAEDAVREAASISASEAVELGVVDFVARDREDLLDQADGMSVTTASGRTVLDVAGAPTVENDMTLWEDFLSLLADPNIAFLFLSLGGVLLLFGILYGGTFFAETLGALMLILGFFSLSVIPYSWVGVILLGLAFILLTAELFVPGTGALGIVGAIALILGGLFLTDTSENAYQVSRWLVFITAGVIVAFFLLVLQVLIKTRRMPVISGKELIIGKSGVAQSELDPDGKVVFDGETWNASSDAGPIASGDRVTVTDVSGLHMTVRPYDPVLDEGASEPPPPRRGGGLTFLRRFRRASG
ncbi:MAG TPA: nodulation protein NfeD [Dehalococcoidia bacterium]|nr:nodulation protein NfeD [Dehalococcoidia bacterium]